jgi:transcriptional antiterminator Rof (Rho-off)
MKDNVNFACNYDLLESLDREAGNMIQTAGTEDHRRAVRAFIEGRKK